MPIKTYKAGVIPKCPHCQAMMDDKIEEFVIPGRIGVASMGKEICYQCNNPFKVMSNGDETYEVHF